MPLMEEHSLQNKIYMPDVTNKRAASHTHTHIVKRTVCSSKIRQCTRQQAGSPAELEIVVLYLSERLDRHDSWIRQSRE